MIHDYNRAEFREKEKYLDALSREVKSEQKIFRAVIRHLQSASQFRRAYIESLQKARNKLDHSCNASIMENPKYPDPYTETAA